MTRKLYRKRRTKLIESIDSGIIVLFGNRHQPKNYSSNVLPFRQDSNFLYYVGTDLPDLIYCSDCDSNQEFLIGNEPTIEDVIWSGQQPSLSDLAEIAGIPSTMSISEFPPFLKNASEKGRKIHYLPPYPYDRQLFISELFNMPSNKVKSGVSIELIKSIINQRSHKSGEEVGEIEWALENITAPMHIMTMKMATPGYHESHIVAEILNFAQRHNVGLAYPSICSVHGEILHNESYRNTLNSGKLLLVDAGAESQNHYASDITRTTPVGRKFSSIQRDIYELVLSAQEYAISRIKPGVPFIDIHMDTSMIIAAGLKDLGLMKGDTETSVYAGAHALFFPHGLGHMMGLDVHDMEDLGEDYVGYDKSIKRSNQFGTAYLRLARKLEPGFVLTVEPGIYFIPVLIDLWYSQKKFMEFINYNNLEKYRDFGGIRIEDDILVTDTGNRILGPHIPKTCIEIEELKH